MKRLAACIALLALASGAQARDRDSSHGFDQRGGYANPSAAIAAEIAFAQLARDKGQWTAFKATAAPDAVMFAPAAPASAMVLAQAWLKNRPDPAVPLTWQPHEVWSSCDGTLMLTAGAWQRGDKHGWFTTVWQRQEKRGYKWAFNDAGETRDAIPDSDMIAAHVADCPDRAAGSRSGANTGRHKHGKPPKPPVVPFDPTHREGRSSDGTLIWRVTADSSGKHDFIAQMIVDGRMQEIRSDHVNGG